MIIEIAHLDDDELGLVDAVERMVFQYGWESHTQQKATGPYGMAFRILANYDLRRQNSSGGWDCNDEANSILFRRTNDLADKDTSRTLIRDASRDFHVLCDRSQYLLALLARLADESLKYPEGYLYHESMSAGEAAMWQLKAFDLIYLDGSGCGHWTEHGKTILKRCSNLGAFPK